MNGFNLTEDQAITAITVAADFGVTQVVDGNWCAPLQSSRLFGPCADPLYCRACRHESMEHTCFKPTPWNIKEATQAWRCPG